MNASMVNLVVQISDKRGRYIERVALGVDGLKIGRAWNSDVIVQDKYVDADQLEITLNEQGLPNLQDVGSTNGSLLENKPLDGAARTYRWGDEIRIGDTTLHLFDEAATVVKTANRSALYSLQMPFQSPRSLAFIGLIAALISTLNTWAFSIKPFKFLEFLAAFASVTIAFFAWTLLFGSISKLVRGQANMRAHWVLTCVATISIVLLSFVISVVRFNIQAPDAGEWLTVLVYASLFVIFTFALLTYASHLGNRAKWFGSLLLVSCTMAYAYSDSLLKQEHELWNGRAAAEQATFPPALMFRNPVSLDDYFDETERLFDSMSER